MNEPSRVRVTGPLASYAPGFREELAGWGYTKSSSAGQLQLMAHVSGWLAGQGLDVGGLTPGCVEQFFALRRAEGRSAHLSQRALAPLLEHLRGLGVVPVAAVAAARTPVEQLLERYRSYLAQERGLVGKTVRCYEDIARRFLEGRRQAGGLGLERLTVADVTGFLSSQCPGRSAGSAKNVASALRSLLRFLQLEGLTALPLAQAVPAGASWSASSLPRALDPKQAARLLGVCDRRKAKGRRDYAILTLLLRLGLRAGEVAALELDDVDWRRGELLIRGKGRRQERLPLPVDVGAALAAYVRRGRPRDGGRTLFLRVPAPHVGLQAASVSLVVYRACDRAGLPRVGAHRLRHTVATEMLRRGAALSEIGQVLRHRSAATTAIYAKVDREALRSLALPWPGDAV